MEEKRNQSSIRNNIMSIKNKRSILSTLVLGLISLSSYLIIFLNEQWVIENFTKGSWYVVYPISTAFFFSLIHGIFISNFIGIIGLEEKK